jgi:hypothetical protein
MDVPQAYVRDTDLQAVRFHAPSKKYCPAFYFHAEIRVRPAAGSRMAQVGHLGR